MLPRIQMLVGTLWLSVLLYRVTSAPRGDLLLQILPSKGHAKEIELDDLSHLLLLQQLSESMAPAEKEALDSIDLNQVHNEVIRQIPVSQRERKAGCRNFYWKTFTSC
ncbi:hypothetical protein DNTS_014024 [Danionella cerebrum]|uniref:Somatostatin/Cortistatin C-terminal domain-containing protein n=1 Tax=Danionella cerebrum TaxID=2873325 RepID=A0A553MQQ0_9TELE|nr:hypothetical protein DNTS_014024 [Danionella translucida]